MVFRRRKDLPQLRSYTDRRRGGSVRVKRRDRLPQPAGYDSERRQRLGAVPTLMVVAIVLLALVLTAPYWLPAVSLVIPDRYVMAYAPGPIQRMIFQIDPSERIPTPMAVDADAADHLLDSLVPSPTMPGGSLPSFGTPGPGGGYVQPTAVAVAPTPTVTPAHALPVDPRADDKGNDADLSQITVLLTGFDFTLQGANNCGPASITTYMSYWGVSFTQHEAANFLKPNPDDPNVRPDEIAAFVAQFGYQTTVRVNGNIDLLKNFIRAGYPVLIETGYDPEPETIGWTSHFLTLAGFSEEREEFIAMDTYRRPNWSYPYSEIDQYWRQFNRRYIVIHRPDQAVAVASIIGKDMDDETMYNNALYSAQLELSLDRSDPFGWFNLGSSLVGLERYEDAATAFDQARSLGLPSRFLWYQFTPFEAYLQTGRYDDVITLADDVLEKIGTEEAFYYKGLAYAGKNDLEQARRQLSFALRYNPRYEAAQLALDALSNS